MIQIDLEKKLEKNRIRALSPIAFEEYMANLFIEYGYEVEQTPPTNDGGKDLILKYDGVKYYVECKHFTEGTVGREIIQKLVGAGIVDGDVYGFIVATTSCFNDNAIKCMERTSVPLFLLDLDDIAALSVTEQSYIKRDIFLSEEDKPKLAENELQKYFLNPQDYTRNITYEYWINSKSIKKVKYHNMCNAVECLYYIDRGQGLKEYIKAEFVTGIFKYFILRKLVYDSMKQEIVSNEIYKTPLECTVQDDFRMRQVRDFVLSHV